MLYFQQLSGVGVVNFALVLVLLPGRATSQGTGATIITEGERPANVPTLIEPISPELTQPAGTPVLIEPIPDLPTPDSPTIGVASLPLSPDKLPALGVPVPFVSQQDIHQKPPLDHLNLISPPPVAGAATTDGVASLDGQNFANTISEPALNPSTPDFGPVGNMPQIPGIATNRLLDMNRGQLLKGPALGLEISAISRHQGGDHVHSAMDHVHDHMESAPGPLSGVQGNSAIRGFVDGVKWASSRRSLSSRPPPVATRSLNSRPFMNQPLFGRSFNALDGNTINGGIQPNRVIVNTLNSIGNMGQNRPVWNPMAQETINSVSVGSLPGHNRLPDEMAVTGMGPQHIWTNSFPRQERLIWAGNGRIIGTMGNVDVSGTMTSFPDLAGPRITGQSQMLSSPMVPRLKFPVMPQFLSKRHPPPLSYFPGALPLVLLQPLDPFPFRRDVIAFL